MLESLCNGDFIEKSEVDAWMSLEAIEKMFQRWESSRESRSTMSNGVFSPIKLSFKCQSVHIDPVFRNFRDEQRRQSNRTYGCATHRFHYVCTL